MMFSLVFNNILNCNLITLRFNLYVIFLNLFKQRKNQSTVYWNMILLIYCECELKHLRSRQSFLIFLWNLRQYQSYCATDNFLFFRFFRFFTFSILEQMNLQSIFSQNTSLESSNLKIVSKSHPSVIFRIFNWKSYYVVIESRDDDISEMYWPH